MLGRSEPRPANALVGLTSCFDELPIDQISVSIDDEPAQLLDAGIEAGRFGALYVIEPPPGEGQTVALHVCEGDEPLCIVFSASAAWVVAAEDHEPPVASATAVVVGTDLVEDDGISCGPFGTRFVVTIEEPVFDIDVAAIRAEVLRDGVVVDGRLGILDADDLLDDEALTFNVHADTSEGACVRVFAMDAAGNATMLGSEVCDPSPSVEDTTSSTSDPGASVADRGCGCRANDGRDHWPAAALLLTVFACGYRRQS